MQDAASDDLIITPADGEDLERLRAIAEVLDTATQLFVCADGGEVVELPESAREGLERVVAYLAANMAVTMKPYDEILTTREAAELLGMSRPYLVQLLESNALSIPVQKVGPGAGGHRRIKLRDVLAYREARDAEIEAGSQRALEEAVGYAEEIVAGAPQPASARANAD